VSKLKTHTYLLLITLFLFQALIANVLEQNLNSSFGHQSAQFVNQTAGTLANSASGMIRSIISRFCRISNLNSILQYAASKKNLNSCFHNGISTLFSFELWNKLIGIELKAIPHSDSVLLI
jgi:hypothetical protein